MPPLVWIGLAVLAATALGSIAAAILLHRFARRYAPERAPDAIYRTAADDGWVLELARYKPAPRPAGSPTLAPVIVCHGLGANAISLDMAEEVSIPRYLRARGFDVWLLDLRGCGGSSTPPPGRGRYDYSFDDLARRDVKAAIELVKRETGAPRVSWVGHSMGGAVLYGHVGFDGDQDLQSVALIASPSGFVERPYFTALSPYAGWLALPTIHHELWGRIASPIAPPIYGWLPLSKIIINPKNVDDRYVRLGLASAMANPSMRLLRQFAKWSISGELKTEDGTHTYFKTLDQVKVPWLAIAGAADRLVPPANVRAGFETLGSPEKRWLLLAEAHGHAADYGHCDLVLGPKVREEVFQPIAEWLERYPLVGASGEPAAAATGAAPGAPAPG